MLLKHSSTTAIPAYANNVEKHDQLISETSRLIMDKLYLSCFKSNKLTDLIFRLLRMNL